MNLISRKYLFTLNSRKKWFFFLILASSANSEVTDRDTTPLMSPNLWKAGNNSGQSTAMAELANLVNAHPRAGMQAGFTKILTI